MENMVDGFHLRDGFYFYRDGDEIVISHLHDGYDGNRDRSLRVTPEEWASAVAATTKRGDNGTTYQETLTLIEEGENDGWAVIPADQN